MLRNGRTLTGMGIDESYDVTVAGGPDAPGLKAGRRLDHDLVLEETAAAVAEHRKEAA